MNANENNNRDDAEVPHEIPPAVPSTSDEEECNNQKSKHEGADKSELNNQSNERDNKNAYEVGEQNINSGILYSQTIMGNPNNNRMMYPNNGLQQFQQPEFDQGYDCGDSYSHPPPLNNNNILPFNQYPLNNNQLPPQHNNMNNILPPNLRIQNQPITMQLPPIPPPPPQPSFLSQNNNNVGGLDAQRQYYEEQMRQHALQYANAAAGAAWAAARIACGGGGNSVNNVNASMSSDIVLQNPGGGFMPSQVQQQQTSYYTPAASGPGIIDNSTQHQMQPGQKRTLWQPSLSGNNNNIKRSTGLKIEAKPKASQQQQDKKRSKKRESGNSSVSSLGSDSRDLKGISSSNKKLSGKKSSQRRRFNEDSNTERVNTSNKRALHHGHGSKSSFSSLGSNSNNNRGRNKKKNRSQSNSSSPQKSTGSRRSILPPPPSIFLGGLLGKNGVRALHELCGKYHWDMPKYTLVDAQSGAQLSENDGSVKSHKDTFCMTVHVNGVELGRGRGGMKTAAKQDGSRKALAALVPGVIFDPNGILTDIGGARSKSLSLDELGPHLASQLAIGGVNGPLGGGGAGIDGGGSETSSISTAIEISEDVIGHGTLVSGGPLLSSKLGALSSPGGSLNASGSGRIFSSNIYPSSGVSSASDVDDEDENAYYASRGASVCSTLLHAMWQIDDRIREPPSYSFDLCPSINSDTASSGEAASSSSKRKKAESPREAPSRPRMFQCIATINLYFPKHLVGDNDDIMTYWQSPLDYLQAKYSSPSPTSDKVEASQSRKRKDSFSFESPSPNKAPRPNHPTDSEPKEEPKQKIESNQEHEKKEEVVLHKLAGTGLGSTKRESKHKASAQLLSSLFPGCSSIVEVKAEAEASRELYAANRVATSQTKRAKLSSPESKKSSKRSAFSGTPSSSKSGISLLGLSLSEPKRVKRTQWTADEQKQQPFQNEVDAALLSLQELDDEGESNNDDDKVGRIILRRATEDDVDHIHALMEKYRSSPSKEECSSTQKESLNLGEEDSESDNNEETQEQQLQLSDETFVLVLSREVATQDPPLGCAILTLDTSSEERALALSKIYHEKHLPREHFDECLETFAKSIHCSIEANSNNLGDSEMTLETIRSCISRSSPPSYQAEDVKSYHQLHSVKEEENEESESDPGSTIVKGASKPSKRSRVV